MRTGEEPLSRGRSFRTARALRDSLNADGPVAARVSIVGVLFMSGVAACLGFGWGCPVHRTLL